MDQLKPPTTYKQQMEKLRSRGCQISDLAVAGSNPVIHPFFQMLNPYNIRI
jgi:hypothetical protein